MNCYVCGLPLYGQPWQVLIRPTLQPHEMWDVAETAPLTVLETERVVAHEECSKNARAKWQNEYLAEEIVRELFGDMAGSPGMTATIAKLIGMHRSRWTDG